MRDMQARAIARRPGAARRAQPEALQPWRIVVLAVVAAMHAGVVVHLSRPVAHDPRPAPVGVAVERIQLVDVATTPEPPPRVRPPPRLRTRPSPERATPPPTPAQAMPRPADPRGDRGAAVADAPEHSGRGAVAPQATFARPPSGARPLRDPERQRLPGREEAIVEGFHVRETASIEDRVLGVAAFVFGGGRPETCDDVRQRLIGAPPGLARDMDVERLQRLCTD